MAISVPAWRRGLDIITKNAGVMYDEFTFGDFCYNRDKFNTILIHCLKKLDRKHRVLDIGCGTGYWLEKMVSLGISMNNIMGIDLSAKNVKRLKEIGFNASCGDALNLNLRDNIADFTICNGVIHHTSDPFKAFTELVRITKSGGHIYLMVYNKFHPYFYLSHRATYPIRYLYWHWNKKIADYFYKITKVFLQPVACVITGQFLSDKTAKTLFMDQIISPRAHLLSKSRLTSYASACHCKIQLLEYIKFYLEIAALFRVEK